MPDPEAPVQALRTPSLHTRVTVVILALLAALLLVLGLTLDAVLATRLEAQLRDRLLDRASFASVVADQVSSPQQLADRLEGDGVSVRLVTSDGAVLTAGRLPGSMGAPDTSSPPGPGGAGAAATPGRGPPTGQADGGRRGRQRRLPQHLRAAR